MGGGVTNLLRMARNECRGLVTYIAAAHDGGLEVASFPEGGVDAVGPAAVSQLVRLTSSDPEFGHGGPFVRTVVLDGFLEPVTVAVAPLGTGGDRGLLGVVGHDPSDFGEHQRRTLERVAQRLTRHLVARDEVDQRRRSLVDGQQPPGPPPCRPPRPASRPASCPALLRRTCPAARRARHLREAPGSRPSRWCPPGPTRDPPATARRRSRRKADSARWCRPSAGRSPHPRTAASGATGPRRRTFRRPPPHRPTNPWPRAGRASSTRRPGRRPTGSPGSRASAPSSAAPAGSWADPSPGPWRWWCSRSRGRTAPRSSSSSSPPPPCAPSCGPRTRSPASVAAPTRRPWRSNPEAPWPRSSSSGSPVPCAARWSASTPQAAVRSAHVLVEPEQRLEADELLRRSLRQLHGI